jgi:hypothetical protein
MFIKVINYISLFVDPRVPTELSNFNLDILKTYLDIVKAR